MRPNRRPSPPPRASRRALPARSRLTVPAPPSAPLARGAARMDQALRASREALTDIEHQLEALLAAVRAPAARPAPDAADRLRRATRRAAAAVARLGEP